ncbi:MAG: hypothetical protein OEN23_14715 [Paracoccaceae bacterium]|nr:hypothetical protein [Paracoccaceae bacterium]
MIKFYLIWYGGALAALAAAFLVTRGWSTPKRIVAITGVAAFGFTTVPLISPDGGFFYPMGAYYLSFGRWWLEAAGKATLVIGAVWAVLAAAGLGVLVLLRRLGRR